MIPYGRHLIEEDDIEAVAEVLRGGMLTQGPVVAEFEAAQQELEQAEARLEALPEEARRAGVPPGWLRIDIAAKQHDPIPHGIGCEREVRPFQLSGVVWRQLVRLDPLDLDALDAAHRLLGPLQGLLGGLHAKLGAASYS